MIFFFAIFTVGWLYHRCNAPFFSVCLKPVRAPPEVGDEWHRKLGGRLHLLDYNALDMLLFFRKDGKIQFVMDLEEHFRLEAFFTEPPENTHHSNLDNVGGSALYGRVHRLAFGKGAFRACCRW